MSKTVIFAGSGSGGHVRPLIGVAQELKKLDSELRIVYVGQKNDRFVDILNDIDSIDDKKLIRAGKFRRFHGLGIRQFFNIPRMLLNIRDVFMVVVGYCQSTKLIKKTKPSAIFIKGGYIGVPLGLAAARKNIPIITHDSDVLPGLANRIIAKWVDTHAVAMPVENYNYPPDRMVQVGVPIPEVYFSGKVIDKSELGLIAKSVVLVMGGSLGAQRLNEAVVNNLSQLTKQAQVVHITGHENYEQYKGLSNENYKVLPFTNDIYEYISVSDVIVSRAGATALAEISAVGKPTIVVANPYLTSGHQIGNARVFSQAGAGVSVDEDTLDEVLATEVDKLMNLTQDEISKIKDAQSQLVRADSAKLLASTIFSAYNRGREV